MNVNNTAWLTARSDQSCRRDTLAWSVSLFVLLDLSTSWQTVCICFYHDWLIRGCLGCLPSITITIIIIINLIKAVTRWLSPVIMSPCAAWETPWENWQQPSQITSVVRCKVVGTAEIICFVSSGMTTDHVSHVSLLLNISMIYYIIKRQLCMWNLLLFLPVKLELTCWKILIATNWELLCFMIHFVDWRIALEDTFYSCMSRPFTWYMVHGIVHPVYVGCKKLVMP